MVNPTFNLLTQVSTSNILFILFSHYNILINFLPSIITDYMSHLFYQFIDTTIDNRCSPGISLILTGSFHNLEATLLTNV